MKCSSCCYLMENHRWLMLYRNRKPHDVNAGKWIGVGGKLEPGETMRQCALREIKEETGLLAEDLKYRGTVWFFYEGTEPEKIWLYTGEEFSGTLKDCDEGMLAWIPEEELSSLSLWEGDRIFLKKLMEQNSGIFSLELHYDRYGTLLGWKEREAEQE